MTGDRVWQAVHAHLDAGRDPLDDADVQAALLADPTAMEEVVALRALLTWTRVAPRPRRWWRRRAAAAAAVAIVAATAVVALWPPRAAPPTVLPMPRFATQGSVRRAVVELCVRSGDEVLWERRETGLLTRQVASAVVNAAAEPATPGRSATVVALAWFENQLR